MANDKTKIVLHPAVAKNLANPEGIEAHEHVSPPSDPAEARRWVELVQFAKAGGPSLPPK